MAITTCARDMTTVGQCLLDHLHSRGVRYIFGSSDKSTARFGEILEDHPIQFINTIQENAAGYMADLYSRMQGLGVVYVNCNVSLGTVSAIARAYVESSPLVIISGVTVESQDKTSLIYRKNLPEGSHSQLEIFRCFTVDQLTIQNASHASKDIERVLHSCLLHKKPVYIELPCDMVDKRVSKDKAGIFFESFPSSTQALQEALAEVSVLLKKSRCPCICLGHEIQRFGLLQSILKFAERLRIPIITSLLGKSAISEKHPLFVGVYQGIKSLPEVNAFVERCDLLLNFGTFTSDAGTEAFNSRIEHNNRVTANMAHICINHHYYQDVNFIDFLDALPRLDLNVRFYTEYPACIDRQPAFFAPTATHKIDIDSFFACMQRYLHANHLVVSDIDNTLAFGYADLVVEQNAFYSCTHLASAGFGIPTAIAAQLIAPKKRVIALIGKSSFHMASMELSTAVRYGIDPIVIVLNNSKLENEKATYKGALAKVDSWNYASLPQLLGDGKGQKVNNQEELSAALAQALEHRGSFYLIEVQLCKNESSLAHTAFN